MSTAGTNDGQFKTVSRKGKRKAQEMDVDPKDVVMIGDKSGDEKSKATTEKPKIPEFKKVQANDVSRQVCLADV